jgi:cytoskeleton protein RodZ
MNDSSEESGKEPQDGGATEPLAGERLAVARREQQIAVGEIAKELHLDEYKVVALEKNEFDVIGAPVFAKGHLRKYAQLVGVSENDVMADYYLLARSAGAPPALKPRRRVRQEISPTPWVVAVAVIIVVAAAYWWFASSDDTFVNPDSVDAVTEPLANRSGAVAPPAVRLTDSAEGSSTAAGDEPDAVAQVAIENTVDLESVATTNNSVAPGQLHLQLVYSGDCWTEITDAKGKRLFFDLGSAGRSVELTGESPFNVLFGNAANVRLLVDGEPFAITVTDNRGTARMTIAGT